MQLRHIVSDDASLRSSDDASSRVSDKSSGPISVIVPSARSRAIRSGGAPGPPGQPRAGRHVIGQHRQRGPAFEVAQHVHVVQDQHHRRGHRRKRPSSRGTTSRAPSSPGEERGEHPLIDRLNRVERFRDVAEQDLRVVVCFVDRHPREGLADARPTATAASSCRTRRADHRNDRARAGPRQTFDQRRTTHGPGCISGRWSLDATRSKANPPAAGPAIPLTARRSLP